MQWLAVNKNLALVETKDSHLSGDRDLGGGVAWKGCLGGVVIEDSTVDMSTGSEFMMS